MDTDDHTPPWLIEHYRRAAAEFTPSASDAADNEQDPHHDHDYH